MMMMPSRIFLIAWIINLLAIPYTTTSFKIGAVHSGIFSSARTPFSFSRSLSFPSRIKCNSLIISCNQRILPRRLCQVMLMTQDVTETQLEADATATNENPSEASVATEYESQSSDGSSDEVSNDGDHKSDETKSIGSIPTIMVTKDGKRKYIRRSVRTALEENALAKEAVWKSLEVGQQIETSAFRFMNNIVTVPFEAGIEGILSQRHMSEEENRSLLSFKKTRQNGDRLVVEVTSRNMETNQVELKLIKIIRNTDFATLFSDVNKSAYYDATVYRHTEGGIVVNVTEFGVVGLIPSGSLIGFTKEQCLEKFPINESVSVKIDQVDIANSKLFLTVDTPFSDVSMFAELSDARWLYAVIQAVSNFGLFVRPVGQDTIGTIAGREIPKDLLYELKSRLNISSQDNRSLLPKLFNVGDIVRCRILNVEKESNRLDLSMLPAEREEGESMIKVNYEEVLDGSSIYEVLVWHNGTKFEAPPEPVSEKDEEDDDENLLEDPDEVNDRNWRRLFEIDAEADNADFEERAVKAFHENLDREIGALRGLLEKEDEYMVSPGFEDIFPTRPKAVIKAISPIPEELLNALNGTFFEKEYRLKDEDIKYPSFSYESYWGPVADELEAMVKAKREARNGARRGGDQQGNSRSDSPRDGEQKWQRRSGDRNRERR